MKKLVIISTLIASFAGLSAFGQGYFQFATAKSAVYDGSGASAVVAGTGVDVAFLWAANGDVPSVDSILASVPTTATSASSGWTTASAWTAILNDPNFHLMVNSGSGNALAITPSTAVGAINYAGGGLFAGDALATPLTAYTLFIIGWNTAGGTLTTPALAAAANATVGWSAPFSYTANQSTGTPVNMSGHQFGVAGIIPEPTTMALAGLGGLALLAIRRRK